MSVEPVETVVEPVRTARARLVLHQPFWGTLALFLQLRETAAVATAATDGRSLFFNPEWIRVVLSKGLRALEAVVCHEVLHCCLLHLSRRGSRDEMLWNIACDYAANHILCSVVDRAYFPDGTLLASEYAGLSAEEIYALLEKRCVRVTVLCQPWGDHSLWEKAARVDSALGSDWTARVAAAAQAARSRGDLPAGLERLVERILAPQVDWRQVLARFLQPVRADYTYFPPDRRFISQDLYLPDFGGEGHEDVVVAVDTSGSVGQKELDMFVAEARGILASFPGLQVHVVSCDAAVSGWHTIPPHSSEAWPQVRLRGGGGTDFRPVFEEISRRALVNPVLVYLTDGHGVAPERAPDFPVLWVIAPGGKRPCAWGEAIDLR